jgi:hypothetical protein
MIVFHTCYSIKMGPRVHDMELKDVVDIIRKVRAGAYSFEAANPRHEHEWRIGADTARRSRAVDRIQAAFPPERTAAPSPALFDRAGTLFRALHGDESRLRDRLGSINDPARAGDRRTD